MGLDDKDKLNRIEELKSKLFNKNYKIRVEHHESFPHFQQRDVVDSWENKEEKEHNSSNKFSMETSFFKKFFIFSIIFFVLSLGYASYIYFVKGNTVSNDNIDISLLSNAFTAGGEEYPLLLEIVNRNNLPLELVDLIVEYPKSSQDSLSQDNEHIRISLGTIPAGGIKNENIKIVLFGEQGSTRQIKISLEYRVEGSNAIFIKDKLSEVYINSTPIDLSINAPVEISQNQDITLDVKAILNSTKSVSKMLIKVDYPIGFQFIKATPAPSSGNNVWDIGDIAPGAERNISIFGKMLDVYDGEEKIFRVWSGSQSTTDKTVIGVIFNSSEHLVLIKKSSIQAKLLINGVYEREFAVDTKTSIQGEIQWVNNLDTKINDLEVRAKISGNAVNRKTISSSKGFYDSAQDLIIWNKNSDQKFLEINPGDSGSLSFSLSPLSLFSASSGIIISPTINVDVYISGRQIQNGSAILELSNSESKTIKIISDVGFLAKGFYSSGHFTNTGPIPPKVGQKTTYTIVWSLSNTSNNISKTKISSILPDWVKFVGTSYPDTEDLVYNTNTREVTWDIGTLPKGAGITGEDKEVSFQIEFIPSLSQINTTPIIINSAILTGHDDFANVDIRVTKPALGTHLLSDTGFSYSMGRVIE
ncbi:MAG: hypothetical protein UR25_C0005G0025 [Candidatus Nomurabacteria bacterium GW2011_GWE1_32_28]|uniref:DUF11 domain-containing protein n=1 Tax=Candidatus Nomurabacteria bacterium GW2011_GWF1_31_48 TaxID=1618767 RepID=A0A0G0BG25_9BACT|nr:MAG: hypothetical protein UR10_C0003G0223 [Candidatus Nomurabacteria bacterium GW2011_GWF2_30_133]KKP28442.1 MAG: hypothetical protein UR18_C0004G0024 [Candidatus Nomurabacteria bacterium GW2011_GWE2_31_40]KKP30022.1 MAG: hypothetical protein UR19_C0005G0024 [Candidatus Nomurabacteria bacterium GW2011_GWF1_31_48]KKP34541.1 MAG: hypothetical protein UR25_C0005G0025 [Candidatus Nomurabacteria bacterium GW2011_GWE1_32_28]HAS81061.1 hypothetical protein [Candidatus Nomurabacteria bacterium]